MSDEVLWFGFALLDMCLVIVIFRFFGRAGLLALLVFNLLLCNIQVLKTVELFGLTATLGNVLYGSVFLITDLLSEIYGKKQAQRAVLLGFIVLGMSALYMHIALQFTPAPGDFAQPHLAAVFGLVPRVVFASMVAYLLSQYTDVWLFHLLRKKTRAKHLWLRNLASTGTSQLLDSTVFCLIAFWGIFAHTQLIEIILATYIFKLLVALLDTPFVYLGRKYAR